MNNLESAINYINIAKNSLMSVMATIDDELESLRTAKDDFIKNNHPDLVDDFLGSAVIDTPYCDRIYKLSVSRSIILDLHNQIEFVTANPETCEPDYDGAPC